MNDSPDPDVAGYAMRVLRDTTNFTISKVACGEHTDVVWRAINLPAGIRGRTTCQQRWASGTCDRVWIMLDFPEIDIGTNDWHDRRKTSVHELGHHIGFGHHASALHQCAMIEGEVPNTDLQWRRWSPHDIDHINSYYF